MCKLSMSCVIFQSLKCLRYLLYRNIGFIILAQNIFKDASGEYVCEPSVGSSTTVTVHVLRTKTEVRAVLGEGQLGTVLLSIFNVFRIKCYNT